MWKKTKKNKKKQKQKKKQKNKNVILFKLDFIVFLNSELQVPCNQLALNSTRSFETFICLDKKFVPYFLYSEIRERT